MSNQFKIKSNEQGIIRLFAVDLPAHEIQTFSEPDTDANKAPWPLKQALGADHLDPDFIELFPVTDLTGVGLSGYMTEGLGIAEQDITPDKARIDALTGHVLIVLSAAFGDVEQTITPRMPLRWIGTYAEETAPIQFQPLPDETATGNVNAVTGPKKISDAAMSGRIATIVLILLGLLVGLMIWIAG